MGTTWSVKCVAPEHAPAETIRIGIENILDGVIAQMSPWIGDSDISRFNGAPARSWHAVPDDFGTVLRCALQVAQQSDGAYDPTVGALVDTWGFGPRRRAAQVPDGDEIAAAKNRCGWRTVRIDDTSRVYQPGGAVLDLSSIAKGFAVDKVSAWLGSSGLVHHLVDIGGELKGQGIKPDGSPWWVALESFSVPERPRRASLADTVVALHGLSVATSGDTVRFFMNEGRRLSHTIDPRTGWPVAHELASVTVFHGSCMRADALATALFVLGPEQGWTFATRSDLAARFVRRTGAGYEEQLTPSLLAMAN